MRSLAQGQQRCNRRARPRSRPRPPAFGRGAERKQLHLAERQPNSRRPRNQRDVRSDRSPVAGGSARAVSRREGRPRRDVDRGSRNEPAAACRGAGYVRRGLQAPAVSGCGAGPSGPAGVGMLGGAFRPRLCYRAVVVDAGVMLADATRSPHRPASEPSLIAAPSTSASSRTRVS